MAGCSADYVEGRRSVVVLVDRANRLTEAPILSDVRGAAPTTDTIVNCQVTVDLQVRTKNPLATDGLVQDVHLTRYEVSLPPLRRPRGAGSRRALHASAGT